MASKLGHTVTLDGISAVLNFGDRDLDNKVTRGYV